MTKKMTMREVVAYNCDLAARIIEACRRACEERLQKQDILLEWANATKKNDPADDPIDDAYLRGFADGQQAAKEIIRTILKE